MRGMDGALRLSRGERGKGWRRHSQEEEDEKDTVTEIKLRFNLKQPHDVGELHHHHHH